MKSLRISLLLMCFFLTNANADNAANEAKPRLAVNPLVTGNQLMDWHKADAIRKLVIRGYVMGVVDARQNDWINANTICIPAGIPASQLESITIKFLEENPEHWHRSGSWLVSLALYMSFPCSTN
jgi:hypothetical protein